MPESRQPTVGSDEDVFRKFASLCDIWLSILTFFVQQSDNLNPKQLEALELLQSSAITLRSLVASEADRQAALQERTR